MKPLPALLGEARAMPDTNPNLRMRGFDFRSIIREVDGLRKQRKVIHRIQNG